MLGWVGLMYTFKWVWAPLIDRVALPVLDKLLGRRRSWILVAQIGVALCLFAISLGDPARSITYIASFAVATAFFAASQDIGIDAWRIESATVDKQGAMAAAYQGGFRIALVVGQAGVFIIADNFGWHAGYLTMSVLMATSMLTTLLVREPQRPASAAAGSANTTRPSGPRCGRAGRGGRNQFASGSGAYSARSVGRRSELPGPGGCEPPASGSLDRP